MQLLTLNHIFDMIFDINDVSTMHDINDINDALPCIFNLVLSDIYLLYDFPLY